MARMEASDFPEYAQYNSQYSGVKETIGFSLWDTINYSSGNSVSLTLFNAIRATIDLSNMELAGQLAAPKAFLLRSISFFVKQRPESVDGVADTNPQTGGINNISLLTNTGVFTLNIGAKNYAQLPLFLLSSGGGPYGGITAQGATAAVGGTVSYGVNGVPKVSASYTLGRPIFIAPQINFSANLFWPAALTLTRDTTVSILFDGDLVRPVQ